MKILYSRKFVAEYKRLPLSIKTLAEKRENFFRKNPLDAKLRTHKLRGFLKGYWAFSINYHYRIIFKFRENNVVWFYSVGTHEVYK